MRGITISRLSCARVGAVGGVVVGGARPDRRAALTAPAPLRRRGISAILIAVALVVLIGFVAMSVDMGRVWLAKAEMQAVADAAARAGALSLPVSNQAVYDHASDAALRNPVIDTQKHDAAHLGERTNPGVELEVEQDIAFGIWNRETREFTELEDHPGTARDERRAANAVRAWGRRIDDRDNPLPLIFAPVLGIFTSNIERQATAQVTGGLRNFGFVGIDSVRAEGTGATIDGPEGRTSTASGGGVASNGDIDLRNADVYGDVRPGIDREIIDKPNTIITGWAANLDYMLDYPAKTFNKPLSDNNDTISPTYLDGTRFVIASGAVTLAPGTYYFKGAGPKPAWEMRGNATVTVTGPATIYVDGDFIMDGNTTLKFTPAGQLVTFFVNGDFKQSGGNIINTGSASDLVVNVTKPGTTVDIGGNPELKMHLYAPLSNVTVNGTPDFTGWIIGKTLRFLGTSKLHYDGTGTDRTPFSIRLVK